MKTDDRLTFSQHFKHIFERRRRGINRAIVICPRTKQKKIKERYFFFETKIADLRINIEGIFFFSCEHQKPIADIDKIKFQKIPHGCAQRTKETFFGKSEEIVDVDAAPQPEFPGGKIKTFFRKYFSEFPDPDVNDRFFKHP